MKYIFFHNLCGNIFVFALSQFISPVSLRTSGCPGWESGRWRGGAEDHGRAGGDKFLLQDSIFIHEEMLRVASVNHLWIFHLSFYLLDQLISLALGLDDDLQEDVPERQVPHLVACHWPVQHVVNWGMASDLSLSSKVLKPIPLRSEKLGLKAFAFEGLSVRLERATPTRSPSHLRLQRRLEDFSRLSLKS